VSIFDIQYYNTTHTDGSVTVTAQVPKELATRPDYWVNDLMPRIQHELASRIADALYERVMQQMDLQTLCKEAAAQVGAAIAERVLGGAK